MPLEIDCATQAKLRRCPARRMMIAAEHTPHPEGPRDRTGIVAAPMMLERSGPRVDDDARLTG